MSDHEHDKRSRFLFLVTWRREEDLPTRLKEVWRGSVKMVAADDVASSHVPARWFRQLDDLPLILRKIIGQSVSGPGTDGPPTE
jgi:hypothetical protein